MLLFHAKQRNVEVEELNFLTMSESFEMYGSGHSNDKLKTSYLKPPCNETLNSKKFHLKPLIGNCSSDIEALHVS